MAVKGFEGIMQHELRSKIFEVKRHIATLRGLEQSDLIPFEEFFASELEYNDVRQKLHYSIQCLGVYLDHYKSLSPVLGGIVKQYAQKRALLDTEMALLTPRPIWGRYGALFSGGVERWALITKDKTSEQILSLVIEDLKSNTGRPFTIECTGTGAHLKYFGSVTISQADRSSLHRLINDIWNVRVKKLRHSKVRDRLDSFVLKYYRHLFPDEQLVFERTYQLNEACERFKDEKYVSLFQDIISGREDENVFIHLLNQRVKLYKTIRKSGSDLESILRNAFPLKKQSQIEELMSVASQDLINILPKDPNGPWTQFCECLFDQFHSERIEYCNQVYHRLPSLLEVSIADFEEVLRKVDPDLSTKEFGRYIGWIFRSHKRFRSTDSMTLADFMRDFRRAAVWNHSK